MKKEIIENVKNLKEQGVNVKVYEDQINDLRNKIFDKKYEKYEKKKTYIESEIDKFLEKYEYENIYITYDNYKNKFDTEKFTKSLKKLRNKFIGINEFKKEYNKFMNNVKNFKDFKYNKKKGSISKNQKRNGKYVRDLEYIDDLYNIKPDSDTSKKDSDTSKKGEGLKILTNKQMLNRLPILLAQMQAGNNSKSLKNEIRQILYSLYRSKVLTKTVYNNLIKSIPA